MFQAMVCRWPAPLMIPTYLPIQMYELDSNMESSMNMFRLVTLAMRLHNTVTRQGQLFNELQIRTRNCIERKFGQRKRRFPILAFGITFKVEKVEAVVITTAVSDNIAKLLNEVDPPINEEEEAAINLVANVNDHPDMNIYDMHDGNKIVRHQLIHYFNELALG
nr:unnamed protein product [Callosobruchus analis]